MIFPAKSLKYFTLSILIVILTLLVLDRVLLPGLESRGELGSAMWKEHNERVVEMMGQRNHATDENPLWKSHMFPVSEEKAGKHRILVIGDSYVWGDGQANLNDIWWRQLQYELEKRGYDNVEVIAAGRCGASTRVELSWMDRLCRQFDPDAIILGYVTNDPDEGSDVPGDGYVKQMRNGPQGSEFSGVSGKILSFFPHLKYQLQDLRSKKLGEKQSGPAGYTYNEWEKRILEGKNFEAYKETVKRLGDFAAGCGRPFLVVTLPMPLAENQKKYAAVEPLFKDAGVKFVNLLAPMLSWYKNSNGDSRINAIAVSPVNGHPGLAANRFYAEKTVEILEKQYAAVLGQKNSASGASRDPSRSHNSPGTSPGKQNEIEINDYLPPVIAVSNPKPRTFCFYQPNSEKDYLLMPLGRPYVQLNLAHPRAFKEIHIVGSSLLKASLAVRGRDLSKDASGKQPPEIYDLGSKKGNGCIFKMPDKPWAKAIDEVMVSAELKGKDDRLVIVEFVEP